MSRIFGLTPGKIRHLHRPDGHDPAKCPFCQADMKSIANILRQEGMKVIRVGKYFLELEGGDTAEEKLRNILSTNNLKNAE